MEIPAELQELYTYLITEGVDMGLSILSALLILIVGFWLAGRISKVVRNRLSKLKRLDDTVAGFVSSLIKYGLILVTVIAVLDQFGVETTSLVAVLGAAGLAIGLALQGVLSNVASGLMLLLFRPFKPGQFVDIGGKAGTVRELALFTTELDTPDNVRITIPNNQIWGQPIANFSHNPVRRIDIGCGIGYGDDMDKAREVMLSVAKAEDRVLDNPGAVAFVDTLGASSVDLVLRIWCNSADYWDVKWDLTKAVKAAFDDAGIEIPFPQQVVTLAGGIQPRPAGE